MYKLPPNFRRQKDGIQQLPYWRPKTLETCVPRLFCAFCSERVKWCTKGGKCSNYAKYSWHHPKKVSRQGRSGSWNFFTPGYDIIKDKDISSPAKKRSACKKTLANGVKRMRFQSFESCNYSVFVPIIDVPWLVQTPSPLLRRPGFDPRPVHEGSVARKWHWDTFLSEYFGVPLVCIIPPIITLKFNSPYHHRYTILAVNTVVIT